MPNPLARILASHDRVILDGALATELERRGADLDDPLWSARILLENPELIRQVHLDYFHAGADCATTASYQATVPGLTARGYTKEESLAIIAGSVRVARDARTGFWGEHGVPGRAYPFIAGSVGPYGAYLADGSEYKGNYGLTEDELIDFHRPRMAALVDGGAEILACETIPCLVEARALARLLAEFPETPAWISFSARDGRRNSQGEPIADCARILDGHPQVAAIGINCTAPRYVSSLVAQIRGATEKPVLVYPNSGERYDTGTRVWAAALDEHSFVDHARKWADGGVQIIGGCCRTTPGDIGDLAGLAG